MAVKRYLTPAEIASALSISRSRAYRLLADLPRVKIGRLVRVAEGDFEAYLRKHMQRPPGAEPASDEGPRPSWLRPLRIRRR